MAREEILTLLDVKTCNLMGYGGRSELTGTDLLAAMKGVDPAGLSTILGRVCNDRSVQSPDFYKIYNQDVIRLANQEKWQINKKDKGKSRFRSLMQMAIYEVVTQSECLNCEGRGYIDLIKPCPTCRTTGRRRYSSREYGQAMRVDQSNWLRYWEPKYIRIINIIKDKEYKVLKKIFKRLKH